MYKQSIVKNIFIGILMISPFVGVVVFLMFVIRGNNNHAPLPLSKEQTIVSSSVNDNLKTSTPTPVSTSTPKISSAVPAVKVTLPAAPAPTSVVKPISVPIPPAPIIPTESPVLPLTDNIIVIQDDGKLIQSTGQVDPIAVAKKFYFLNPGQKDNYDFLSLFTTFHDTFTPEYYYGINRNVAGISARTLIQSSPDLPSKLLGINFLNDTYSVANDNTQENIKNNLFLMVHETSHQWLMETGKSYGISDGQHYTKWIDTGFMKNGQQWGDVMGGWPWKDNGDGTMSVDNIQKQGFTNLSLYLMGFIPASDVPEIKVVIPANSKDTGFQNVKGVFKKISINDIIAQYGLRVPSYQNSQKNFKMAYILLIKKGDTSAQYEPFLNIIKAIAKVFPTEWNLVTNGKSTINN